MITTNNNNIPQPLAGVINLAQISLTGAQAFGEAINLQHNPATAIAADLYNLIGDPATPLVPGKQTRYTAQVVAVKNAHTAKRAAIAAGREFCRLAINVLRPVLGNRWNTAWQAAGFHQPSLALPLQPLAMLTGFRGYFAENPTRENASLGVTAVLAQARITAINGAVLAVATAKDTRITRKAERDAALVALRSRLSDLRGELEQLLEDDEGTWYEFGFRRPIDGRQPAPVLNLVLTPGGAGIVLASWAASSLAENYRIVWRPSSGGATTEAGLVGETQFALTGLPSGVPIIIGLSARNSTGETAPTEAAIVVP